MAQRTASGDRIRVLHVEDDEAFADLTAAYFERLDADIRHEAVRTVGAARRRCRGESFDAVVCDYDLPDGTGIDLLERVREIDPELPFVLFTGKGSEEVASEAISAGVTDYLQKRGGTDQYEVLVNRIRNAVDRHRLMRQVDRAVAALEAASEPIGILGADGTYLFANEAYASVYGLAPDDVVGTHWRAFYPDEEVDRFVEEILPRVTAEGYWSGEAVVYGADDRLVRERLALTHTTDGGHVCIVRETEPIEESSPNVASADATHPNAGDRDDPDVVGSDAPDAVGSDAPDPVDSDAPDAVDPDRTD
ncbi:PAS domain S-box-containing protein [Halorubrum trapanicum]|uniref:PAS domain S-box-containing protein n=1 Tax=Halorubrum trapanicum TaxID=29284 RepID=A0A8J7UMV7_9EURY|nr:response regulator [Halorubrum trapanicum]MBP1901080.1 PAS domain S-box-containing protein [Halorubrum trapanicum]